MSGRTVVLAHGLEGSPEGGKAQALRAAGLSLVAPDGRKKPLADRVQAVLLALESHPQAVLVGSSYGGLAALAAVDQLGAARRPHALVLLAPALMWREPPVADPEALMVPAALRCVVFHGESDRVVPLSVSESLAARCPHVELRIRDDNHRLTATLPEIVKLVATLARD